MIDFEGVSKRFGSTLANDSVSFSIERQTIHGVVGENGAGKSTIMKILYGAIPFDSGSIHLDGKSIQFQNPHEAINHGVGMVHQQFMLVDRLTVWENIILGHEQSFFLSLEKAETLLGTLLEQYQAPFALSDLVENLSVGQKQQVEILKLLYRDAEVLILDEPTAVLTPQETSTLFDRLRHLQSEGKTIVIITHKIKEILEVTERVTIMRRGRVVGTRNTRELYPQLLSELIMGDTSVRTPLHANPTQTQQSELILEFCDVSTRSGTPPLQNISFTVKSGEILGVAGISGNGQDTVVNAIIGLVPIESGQIQLDCRPLRGNTYERRRLGIGIIPSDRHAQGMISEMTLAENAILGMHRESSFYKHGFLSKTSLSEHSRKLVQQFHIRPDNPSLSIGTFSGGNQQKLVVGRELSVHPRLVVAAYPTRGVDVGTMAKIHDELIASRNRCMGVLLISSEIEELLALSDRILVLYQGRIAMILPASETNEALLGIWMMGGK